MDTVGADAAAALANLARSLVSSAAGRGDRREGASDLWGCRPDGPGVFAPAAICTSEDRSPVSASLRREEPVGLRFAAGPAEARVNSSSRPSSGVKDFCGGTDPRLPFVRDADEADEALAISSSRDGPLPSLAFDTAFEP